eukprot:403374388
MKQGWHRFKIKIVQIHSKNKTYQATFRQAILIYNQPLEDSLENQVKQLLQESEYYKATDDELENHSSAVRHLDTHNESSTMFVYKHVHNTPQFKNFSSRKAREQNQESKIKMSGIDPLTFEKFMSGGQCSSKYKGDSDYDSLPSSTRGFNRNLSPSNAQNLNNNFNLNFGSQLRLKDNLHNTASRLSVQTNNASGNRGMKVTMKPSDDSIHQVQGLHVLTAAQTVKPKTGKGLISNGANIGMNKAKRFSQFSELKLLEEKLFNL